MRFRVQGASSVSGEDVSTVIEAIDKFNAERIAREGGLLIESIEPITEELARSPMQRSPVQRVVAKREPAQIIIAAPPPPPPPAQQSAQPVYVNVAAPPVQVNVTNNMPRPTGTSGFGVIALVLGIIALLVCWIPLLGMLAIPVAVLGLLLAGIGFLISLVGRRSSIGMPFAGGVACALAIFVSVTITGAVVGGASKALKEAERAAAEQRERDRVSASAETAAAANQNVASGTAPAHVPVAANVGSPQQSSGSSSPRTAVLPASKPVATNPPAFGPTSPYQPQRARSPPPAGNVATTSGDWMIIDNALV